MIYTKNLHANEEDFIDLLRRSKETILLDPEMTQGVSPLRFESLVFEHMQKAAAGGMFEGTIHQTSAHAFPDIVANHYFGAEVKITSGDQWTSVGNSVLESSRVDEVERIYLFFGKVGGNPDIRYRPYQECLSEVSVTHSPRYRINMDLAMGKSIFDKMGIDYDSLRINSPIQKIKEYYRARLQEGEELWWIDSETDERTVSPVIKPYRSLPEEEKTGIISECMILFPEMFGGSNTKFERAAAYLIATHNVISANIRDIFSAGGKEELNIQGKTFLVPQILHKLHTYAKDININLEKMDEDRLTFYWRIDQVPKNRIELWKQLLDQKSTDTGTEIKASEIFETGLR